LTLSSLIMSEIIRSKLSGRKAKIKVTGSKMSTTSDDSLFTSATNRDQESKLIILN